MGGFFAASRLLKAVLLAQNDTKKKEAGDFSGPLDSVGK